MGQMKPSAREVRQAKAIEAAWCWFSREMSMDVSFAAVVARVRAQCPEVELERIRLEFERRLNQTTG